MRIKISDRQLLFFTYVLLILFFLRAQSVAGPYDQSLRARIVQSTSQHVVYNP
ncbi:MAG: hypothetical protein ACKO6Q_03550 [Bacteroidota bacterium]